MTIYGISGHQTAPGEAWALLDARLRDLLRGQDSFVGVSSLAAGADQRFAEIVLQLGGELHVVVPSEHYESTFETPDDRRRFEDLVAVAAKVEHLACNAPDEEAFLAAGYRVVELCDVLVAVWDGLPAQGKGGTADVVAYARSLDRPVLVVWPAGAKR